jgi:hypothetical protein
VTRHSELRTTLATTSNQCTTNASCMHQLLVTANILPSSPIPVTLMMEALHSSETLVLTSATWCNIPEDSILHGHCRENLKSYIFSSFSNIKCQSWGCVLLCLHFPQMARNTENQPFSEALSKSVIHTVLSVMMLQSGM